MLPGSGTGIGHGGYGIGPGMEFTDLLGSEGIVTANLLLFKPSTLGYFPLKPTNWNINHNGQRHSGLNGGFDKQKGKEGLTTLGNMLSPK